MCGCNVNNVTLFINQINNQIIYLIISEIECGHMDTYLMSISLYSLNFLIAVDSLAELFIVFLLSGALFVWDGTSFL